MNDNNKQPTHHAHLLPDGAVFMIELPMNAGDPPLTTEQQIIIEQDEEIVRLKAMLDDMPKTKDKVPAYDGMELFTSKKQHYIYEPHAETKAYWITYDGEHITDSIGKFYSSQEAADEADKEDKTGE